MRASPLVLAAACLLACTAEQQPIAEPPSYQAVLEAGLIETAADALPEVEEAVFENLVELLELATLSSRNGETAWRQLESMDGPERTAALLLCVESREFPPELRLWAYAALRDFGSSAMLPRLTLRLKYEKDWGANVPLAEALLRHGSGAGLAALETILQTEDTPVETRTAAALALLGLPAKEGWVPGAAFSSDWQRLVEVRAHWLRYRVLPDAPTELFDGPMRAACWRMLSRFRSQPLRPVDDARRVFERLPAEGFDFLIAITQDEDLYVREHALQTLAWIGPPVGLHLQSAELDLPTLFAPLLADAVMRARTLEALGASNAPGAAAAVLPYLDDPVYDVVTAAADALLRCGDASHAEAARLRLAAERQLSPEARYSLGCVLLIDSDQAPPPVDGLDPSEQARRDSWLAARRD